MEKPRHFKAWMVLAFGTALVAFANLAVAFPFWLDSPRRSNPHDPKSTLYKVTVVYHSPTYTYTISPTLTATPTLTASPTTTPSHTQTLFVTATDSPTASPTRTHTPVVTATNTQVGTATMTSTPAVTSAVVDDFEGGATRDQTMDNWGFPVDMVADAASTIFAQPAASPVWVSNSASTPGSTGTYCAHLTGTLAGNPASAYAYFATELNGTGYTADTSLASYTGFSFDFKAGTAGILYSVGLIQTNVSASGSPTALYQYQFRPVDTAWHTITCYFPPAANPYPPQGWCITQLAQPPYGWVVPVSFTKAAGAIQFSPVVQTTAVNFDMSIDNIKFVSTAEPTPPALDASYSSIDYFDFLITDQSHCDPSGPFAGAEVYTGQGGATSTMSSPPNNMSNIWPAGYYNPAGCPDATDPVMAAANSGAGSSAASGEFTGTVDPSGWAIWQFAFTSGGYPYSAATPVVLPGILAPNGRLVFDAKTTVPATTYEVQFETQYTGPGTGPGQPGNDYNFYAYHFKLTGTWTTYSIFLPTAPGVGFGPQIQDFNRYYPFDNTHCEGIEFGPVDGATNIPYDMSLDNVRLD
jgi:hypothetical protein